MKKVIALLIMIVMLAPAVCSAERIISIGGTICQSKTDAILLSNLSIQGSESSMNKLDDMMMEGRCTSLPGDTEVTVESSFKGDVDGDPTTFYAIRIPSNKDQWYIRDLEIEK